MATKALSFQKPNWPVITDFRALEKRFKRQDPQFPVSYRFSRETVKAAVIFLDAVSSTLNGFLGMDGTLLGKNEGLFDENEARFMIINTTSSIRNGIKEIMKLVDNALLNQQKKIDDVHNNKLFRPVTGRSFLHFGWKFIWKVNEATPPTDKELWLQKGTMISEYTLTSRRRYELIAFDTEFQYLENITSLEDSVKYLYNWSEEGKFRALKETLPGLWMAKPHTPRRKV